MDASRKIAVTGIGWVTPLGAEVPGVWNALLEGRSGIGPITRFDCARHSTTIAGEIRDFDPTRYMDRAVAKRLDRFAQFAMAASSMALEDSGLELGKLDLYRVATVIGSGAGGRETLDESYERLFSRGPDRIPPMTIPMMMVNAAAGAVSARWGLRGPSYGVASACSTGALALTEAAGLIMTGQVDAALAGGAEASITAASVGAFSACGALSKRNGEPARASRPFDRDRDGFVMSEGGAVLVLEEMERARARGARIYSEFAGWGLTSDAHHVVMPEPGGEPAARSIMNALRMAGAEADEVGYINAHGTGTPLNDPAEVKAIRQALGPSADKVPVSSTKSMMGHMLGAAGAAEAAIAALSLHSKRIPPTINVENQAPECDLDVVPGAARESKTLRLALSNSFAFGGHNAVLALRGVN